MRPFEYSGVWWLPGSTEHVAGTITYDGNEYPRLKLIGLLHELRELNNLDHHYDLVLGVAGGKNITLSKAIQVGTSFSFPGIATSEIDAPIVIVGGHVDRLENLRFKNMAISYEHLIEWSGVTAITQRPEQPTENGRPSLTIRVEAPSFPDFTISDARCRFATSWTASSPSAYEAGITQDIAIEVEPPQPRSLEEYLSKYFYHIQNFLALGVGAPVGIRRVSGSLASEESLSGVDVYFKSRTAESKTVHPPDMLFRRGDLGEEWHRALDRWIERAEVLRPVYDLFFSTVFSSSMYLQHEFLSLTQALESYHRRTVPGTYLSDDIFSDLQQSLDTVIATNPRVPVDVRNALTPKLKYFNEFSQRRRFKDILRELGDLTGMLIPDQSEFVDLVVNTRNYLTHYDPGAQESAASNDRIWYLSEQLRFVLELCLLRELGLSGEKIGSLVHQHQWYLHLRSQLRRATVTST